MVDFNLEFYTEVQDLSHLGNALSSASPRYAALNMAICELIEDFSLVGFETLAVEVRRPTPPSPSLHTKKKQKQDKHSMLNLTRAIDRATGYVFVPPPQESSESESSEEPGSSRPNAHALLSSAMGPRVVGLRSEVRDVQERWVDAREEWDAYERAQWRREGEAMRRAVEEVGAGKGAQDSEGDIRVRERRGL